MSFKVGESVKIIEKTFGAPLSDTHFKPGDTAAIFRYDSYYDVYIIVDRDNVHWGFNFSDLEQIKLEATNGTDD